MNYKDLPESLIEKLNVEDLQVYVEAAGWKKNERFTDGIAVYRLLNDKVHEIIIPLDRDYADYNQRIADVIVEIADVENRTPEDVLDELLEPYDSISFQINGSVVTSGAIQINTALSLLNDGRRALKSVNPLEDQSQHHASSLSKTFQLLYIALHYQHRTAGLCRFETNQDSFAVRFVYPLKVDFSTLAASLQSQGSEGEGEKTTSTKVPDSYARSMITTLIRSLDVLVNALTEGDMYKLLSLSKKIETPEGEELHGEEIEGVVINQELCEAILNMRPRDGSLSIYVSWARVAPFYGEFPSVHISQPLFNAIEEFLSELRAGTKPKEQYYVGRIKRVGDNQRGETFLVLLDNDEDELISVRVELKSYDFEKARNAYDKGYRVGILGELHRDKPVSHIRQYKVFQILAPLTMGEGSFSFLR